MLSLKSVSKSYGKKAVLSDIDHEFDPGLNILTGPSGAGKSTLLRLCATVEKPSSGSILWNEKNYTSARRALRFTLGYAPQIVDLPLDITGREFLAHFCALKGLGAPAKKQADEILEQLGLAHDADQRIIGWSGGMRRRLILAQSLLGSPQLLCLDEPTAELDRETAERVSELITHASSRATVILTTHLAEHFQAQGASLLRVDGGKLSKI